MDAALNQTARALVAPGKGILAADESSGTIKKRFDSIGVESTEDRRRAYREMLFTTAGAEGNISGVILFDETIRQQASDGRQLVQVLEDAGILPGIKVDKGTTPLAGAPGELVTDGLDGLRARLVEYRELGAKFAKWRAVIDIGDRIPSQYCIHVNAHALARYAALCQDEGIVPIVEPEVLMDGDHSIGRCFEVTTDTLHAVFDELMAQRVQLDGMLLKPNMVIPGKKFSGGKAAPRRSRRRRSRAFVRSFPRPYRGSSSCRAGRATRRPRPTSTRSTSWVRTRGRCRSRTAGRCRPPPCRRGWAGTRTRRRARRPSCTGPT